MNMTKVCLSVCIIWVALSLGLLSCQRPSNIKFDETGFYILKEEDTFIHLEPRIQPKIEGYGKAEAQRRGMVPDKETAIKIAESVWYPIYGSEIYTELPFIAELEGDTVWEVRGSLPEGWLGGTAVIRLRKSDAAVQNVWHEK
ncbi:MAG: hypothetical protein IKH25_09350 [Muribaculaceae bacterium]|nr:hypothetical protein [Muribaculaceae bacterium]